MKIQIKKRISLDFLGEEYKEGYIVLEAIPLREYDAIIEQTKKVGEDNSKALAYMKDFVQTKFIEGKFPNEKGELEDLTKENLLDFPAEVFFEVMAQISGRTPENLEKP